MKKVFKTVRQAAERRAAPNGEKSFLVWVKTNTQRITNERPKSANEAVILFVLGKTSMSPER